MKTTKKKIRTYILILAMIMTMLPGMSVTVKADDITSYGLWIGDEEVKSDHLSGTGWSYDPNTGTLTLNDYKYEGKGHTSSGNPGAIYSQNKLNIVLQGSSSVINTSDTSGWNCGIYLESGDLTISGSGTLNVTGGTGSTSHGISVYSGNLTISDATITAIGQKAMGSSGIFARGSVIINSGNVTAIANESTAGISRGIECDGSFIMNGGTVIATADKATKSYGIQAWENIEFKAGKQNLKGETWAYYTSEDKHSEGQIYSNYVLPELKADDFTFTASSDLIYDGTEKTATIEKKTGTCGTITVKYYNANGEEVKPIEAGVYTVKIDVAGNEDYKQAENLTSDEWKFEIVLKTYTFTMKVPDGASHVSASGALTQTVSDKIENIKLAADNDHYFSKDDIQAFNNNYSKYGISITDVKDTQEIEISGIPNSDIVADITVSKKISQSAPNTKTTETKTPATKTTATQQKKAAKTGDENPAMWVLILMMIGGAGAATYGMKRKKTGL